jgi:hypothetical protein
MIGDEAAAGEFSAAREPSSGAEVNSTVNLLDMGETADGAESMTTTNHGWIRPWAGPDEGASATAVATAPSDDPGSLRTRCSGGGADGGGRSLHESVGRG